jgi:hypothetical protein
LHQKLTTSNQQLLRHPPQIRISPTTNPPTIFPKKGDLRQSQQTAQNHSILPSDSEPSRTLRSEKWPLSESNLSQVSIGKQASNRQRGANSGALKSDLAITRQNPDGGIDASFGEAVKAILELPLSKAEKAEAVRRLLAGRRL